MADIALQIGTFPKKRKRGIDYRQQGQIRRELAANITTLLHTKGFGRPWLSKWTKIALVTIIDIVSGHRTKPHVTVETLYRIGRMFSCEPDFRDNDGESLSVGATAVLEELVCAGVWITFVDTD